MNQDTPETWKDRKRNELIREQMEMAYELARISIQIKELRHEPAVPEGSIPLSMIEPLINETVERLLLLSNSRKPKKPKRITCDLILDEIGNPNLIIQRVVHRLENSGHKLGWKFVYLRHDPLTSPMAKAVGERHVNHRNLKDLTLEQWVENGRKLIEQVELRIDLYDAISTVSPDRTPFQL